MDPMLMAIIAVVVVAILAGVFFLKGRGKGGASTPTSSPTSKSSNRPKTLGEQQRDMAANPVTPVAPLPEVNHLAVAQQYFDQQDYSNAVSTLKTAIANQPNRADLQLLLLRTYAEQKNYAEFDQTYQSLNQLNDPAAAAQASGLKTLLDEEQSFALNSPVAAVAPATMASAIPAAISATPDMLDFDDFSFDEAPAKPVSPPPAVAVEELDFSFDDLETQVIADNKSMAQTPAMVEETSFDFDLENNTPTTAVKQDLAMDLDFPELTTETTPIVEPTLATSASNAVTDDSFDFDTLSLDTPVSNTENTISKVEDDILNIVQTSASRPVTTSKPGVIEAEEFDFDFDDKADSAQSPVTTANSLDSVAELDDFDLSFDAEPEVVEAVKTTPTQTLVSPSVTDDAFSFDLGNDVSTIPSGTQNQPAKDLMADDFSFDLSDDLTSDVKSDTNDVIKNPAEFDLSLLDAKAPTAEPSIDFEEYMENDTLSQLDAMYAPEAQPASQTPTDSSFVTNDSSAPTPDNVATEFDSQSLTSTVTAPVVPQLNEKDLSQAFDFIKDMDTTQLNIDLAEQYIELGEFDSAKRLLNEISNANPTQQTLVHSLLEKIG